MSEKCCENVFLHNKTTQGSVFVQLNENFVSINLVEGLKQGVVFTNLSAIGSF